MKPGLSSRLEFGEGDVSICFCIKGELTPGQTSDLCDIHNLMNYCLIRGINLIRYEREGYPEKKRR